MLRTTRYTAASWRYARKMTLARERILDELWVRYLGMLLLMDESS